MVDASASNMRCVLWGEPAKPIAAERKAALLEDGLSGCCSRLLFRGLLCADAAMLTRTVGEASTGGKRRVGPLALHLPLRSVGERQQRSAESEVALIAILLA